MKPVVGQQYQQLGMVTASLGGTACGEVFLIQTAAHGDAALKVPHDLQNPDQRLFLEQEREILLALNGHPNIVQLIASGTVGQMPWLLLELLQKRPPRAQTPAPDAIAQLADLCSALEVAHGHGFVHRDLHPTNIMTSSNHWKIIDWGASYRPGSALPNALLATLGTPPITAPEAWQGTVDDPRSDLYSLGCCLYWFLTGHFPFGEVGTRKAIAAKHLNDPIPLITTHIPQAPADYQALVNDLLEKAPANRIQTAGIVRQRLLALPPIP